MKKNFHLFNCDIRDFITYIFTGPNPSLHNDDVSKDPLFITTRLLSDALTRLRIFVFGLDPMQWLSWRDRNVLYTSQICCLAVLKASVGVGTYTCILELFHSIFIIKYQSIFQNSTETTKTNIFRFANRADGISFTLW